MWRSVRDGCAKALLAAAGLLLAACSHTAPVCDPSSADGLRVMLRFREPVDGQSTQTLRQLQDLGQTCVQAVGSVSPTIHVYRFAGASDLAVLRQRLLTWPVVLDVQPDAAARRATPP